MIDGCVVAALVRAEKVRQKKCRLPSTPHNLSIHKDVSRLDMYQSTTVSAIPVVQRDENREVLMGEF